MPDTIGRAARTVLTSWLAYRSLAAYLDRRLPGAEVVEAFTQAKSEAVFVLSRAGEVFFLRFWAERGSPTLVLWPDFARARRNAADLFPALVGAAVSGASVAVDDRLVRVAFGDGRALLCTFFPVGANAYLVDASLAVLDVFKKVKSVPPLARSFDNAHPTVSARQVAAALAADGTRTVADAVRAIRPWMSGTFLREWVHRAGIDAARPCASLDDASRDALGRACAELLREAARDTWTVCFDDDVPRTIAPFALTHAPASRTEEEPSINEALVAFLRARFRSTAFAGRRDAVLRTAHRELARTERRLEKLAAPEDARRRADEYEKYGNLLTIHLTRIPEQPDRMIVPDIFVDPRLVVPIPLDARLTLSANAERYFDRARRARASMTVAAGRRASLERRRDALRTLAADAEGARDAGDLAERLRAHTTLLANIGMTPKGESDDRPFLFRRFVVAGGFEVWAGRNSANNDELTVRHAKPNDLWFHARGVGGSHVVLRRGSAEGSPGRDAIRQAAAIAAYYSKHRNARSVPVSYTERKYVRKPRGVPAGTVYLEREKSILVAPALPPGQERDDAEDA